MKGWWDSGRGLFEVKYYEFLVFCIFFMCVCILRVEVEKVDNGYNGVGWYGVYSKDWMGGLLD